MNGWNKRRAYSEGFITIIILDEMVQIEDGNEQLKDRNDEKEGKGGRPSLAPEHSKQMPIKLHIRWLLGTTTTTTSKKEGQCRRNGLACKWW